MVHCDCRALTTEVQRHITVTRGVPLGLVVVEPLGAGRLGFLEEARVAALVEEVDLDLVGVVLVDDLNGILVGVEGVHQRQLYVGIELTVEMLNLLHGQIEEGAVLGEDTLLLPHGTSTQPELTVKLAPIHVGAGAIVGARAIILPGVKIGPRAAVAPNSVVKAHTVIPAGEVWGGVPARRMLTSNAQHTD